MITPIILPDIFAKTSLISAVLVAVKASWHISMKLPYKNADRITIIAFLAKVHEACFFVKNTNHKIEKTR